MTRSPYKGISSSEITVNSKNKIPGHDLQVSIIQERFIDRAKETGRGIGFSLTIHINLKYPNLTRQPLRSFLMAKRIASSNIKFFSNLTKKSQYPRNSNFRSLPLKLKLRNMALYLLLTFLVTSIASCALLRWCPAPTSSFMLYRHFDDLVDDQTFKSIDYTWVSSEKISPNASAAVIAAEDQHFFQHSGFDLDSIQSSIDDYMEGGRLRGASTISQQVAKNLFLTPSKSFLRKGLEVWFTLLIEMMWSKERILVMYLNIAEFGDHLFGIEAASRNYFGIPAKQLSRSQAALLAATLPNPIALHANRPSSYVLKRQHWILRQMQNLGYYHKKSR